MLQNGKKTNFPYECSNLLLGRGGSGAVFLARDIESKAYVAVKRTYNKPKPGCGEPQIQLEPSQLPLFSRKQSNSLEDMASFTNGAHFNLFSANNQAASSVQPEEWEILEHIGFHPHIVSCLGHHTSTRNVTYFAMELMNSDAAREVTKGNEYIKQEQVYSGIAFSILEALAFIHDKGIVHGDIKPGNILFKSVSREKIGSKAVILHEEADNSFTKAYLGDFSVSRFVNVTASTGARGTLYYKPPEQLLGGQIRNSTACDMWSFGCALLEIVMGALTFSGDNEFQVCMNILSSLGSSFENYPLQNKDNTFLDSISISPQLRDLLKHLLVLEPAERYTAKEAMSHPFFDTIRNLVEKQEPNSKNTANIILTLPLKCARSPASYKKGVAYQRVMATPLKRERDILNEMTSSGAVDFSSFVSEEPSVHWSRISGSSGEVGGQNKISTPCLSVVSRLSNKRGHESTSGSFQIEQSCLFPTGQKESKEILFAHGGHSGPAQIPVLSMPVSSNGAGRRLNGSTVTVGNFRSATNVDGHPRDSRTTISVVVKSTEGGSPSSSGRKRVEQKILFVDSSQDDTNASITLQQNVSVGKSPIPYARKFPSFESPMVPRSANMVSEIMFNGCRFSKNATEEGDMLLHSPSPRSEVQYASCCSTRNATPDELFRYFSSPSPNVSDISNIANISFAPPPMPIPLSVATASLSPCPEDSSHVVKRKKFQSKDVNISGQGNKEKRHPPLMHLSTSYVQPQRHCTPSLELDTSAM